MSCDVSGLTSGPLSGGGVCMQSMWPGQGAFEPCDTDDVAYVHRTACRDSCVGETRHACANSTCESMDCPPSFNLFSRKKRNHLKC